jgi:trehalose-6-phosphate synthase
MADTILKAFRMSQAERSVRMKRMRHVVRKENVFWWVDSFLKAGAQIRTWQRRASKRRQAASAR